MNIEIGTKHEITVEVSTQNTAKTVGSGKLDVFATPAMIAAMEQSASELCEKFTDVGMTTVGTKMSVSHLAASAIGTTVVANATVTAFDGRKITFDVTARDNAGLIGEGTHERFCVKIDKFLQKSQERKDLEVK